MKREMVKRKKKHKKPEDQKHDKTGAPRSDKVKRDMAAEIAILDFLLDENEEQK